MTVPVFYSEHIDPTASSLTLTGDEANHATVRRVRPGEQVDVTDGRGRTAHCTVQRSERDALECAVGSVEDQVMPQPSLTVVQALPKGDRGEVAVETMTEVGVDRVVPWAAARCITRWKGERGERSRRRWRAVSVAAAKQAGRAWWPQVAELATTRTLADLLRTADCAVVLHEEATTPLVTLQPPRSGSVVLVVGPEGGIGADELDVLSGAGAVPARLGPTVLRTSTAGTVAAGVVLAATQRWC